MRVRLLKPWKFRRVGVILNDVPDGVANILVQQRRAERMPEIEDEDEDDSEKRKRLKRVRP